LFFIKHLRLIINYKHKFTSTPEGNSCISQNRCPFRDLPRASSLLLYILRYLRSNLPSFKPFGGKGYVEAKDSGFIPFLIIPHKLQKVFVRSPEETTDPC